jgi:hypothetical protein
MAAAAAEPVADFAGAADAPDFDGRPPALPLPCPVTPLGQLGGRLVFLDRAQQVVIAGTECKKGDLKLWFGNEYLLTHFEQMRGKNGTSKVDQDDAQTALVEACYERGIFNPQGKVLGRGAHSPEGAGDTLVLHVGRAVLIAEPGQPVRRELPGKVMVAGKALFFPADSALEPPGREPSTRREAEELLAKFNTWNWVSPPAPLGGRIDSAPEALLLFGWVGQAFICGALDWRAHAWLAAPTASGKTALQDVIRALLDEWVVKTADASEPGIRQVLRNDTLAVSIDEAEKEDNPERQKALLNLIKKSSSGDIIIRGSAEHKAQEFTAQSAFLMSSVLHATFKGEDRNRIALLQMRPLAESGGEFDKQLPHWRKVGRRMHRRMIEQWPRFERTLTSYRRAIGAHGYDGRWQDTYGTLLACADLLLHDSAPDGLALTEEHGLSRVDAAVAAIVPLLAKGKVEARTDTERAIAHLMSKPLPGSNGKSPEPVGRWLERAMAEKYGTSDMGSFPDGPDVEARDKLKAHGLRVVQMVKKPNTRSGYGWSDALLDDEGWNSGFLAIAYGTNAALQELWRGTEWSGDGYLQSLRKLPGAHSPEKIRFAGVNSDNALVVPLKAFRGDDG